MRPGHKWHRNSTDAFAKLHRGPWRASKCCMGT
nr:unnamed protein product [Callosobruchus analis]